LEKPDGTKEIWKITSITGDTLSAGSTANRAQEGTSMQAFSVGDVVEGRPTKSVVEEALALSGKAAISAIKDLTPAADRVAYYTGASAAALAVFTAFARSILDDVDAPTARTTLGVEPAFASGTRWVFQQTSAPTGYVKETNATYNDAALRFTTGTVGTGGADAFNTLFGTSKTTAGHSLATSEIPSHVHVVGPHTHPDGAPNPSLAGGGAPINVNGGGAATGASTSFDTSPTGGGGAHSHTLNNMNLKFVDCIVAAKA